MKKIFLQRDAKKKKITLILHLAKCSQVPVFLVSKERLDSMGRGNQGAVAFFSSKETTTLDSLLAASENPLLVLLDGVEDPQNLGAILRSAECAGACGVIILERRAAGITAAVYEASAGAAAYMGVCRVKNLARTMDELKKRGIWLVGAEAGQRELWYEFDYTLPIGIVLGSEGKGLRPLIKKKCDKLLSLPLMGKMTSLNVSAAAAVFLYEVVKQRLRKRE